MPMIEPDMMSPVPNIMFLDCAASPCVHTWSIEKPLIISAWDNFPSHLLKDVMVKNIPMMIIKIAVSAVPCLAIIVFWLPSICSKPKSMSNC